MKPDEQIMFVIAERIGCSVADVERMSTREVLGWKTYLQRQATAANAAGGESVMQLDTMTREQKRAAFKR